MQYRNRTNLPKDVGSHLFGRIAQSDGARGRGGSDMKINKTRYLNAKKQITRLQKFRKVVDDWEKSLKDCPFKEHVTAIDIADDGTVTMECQTNGATVSK